MKPLPRDLNCLLVGAVLLGLRLFLFANHVRMPTIIAWGLRSTEDVTPSLLFGEEVISALREGLIREDEVIRWLKIGILDTSEDGFKHRDPIGAQIAAWYTAEPWTLPRLLTKWRGYLFRYSVMYISSYHPVAWEEYC